MAYILPVYSHVERCVLNRLAAVITYILTAINSRSLVILSFILSLYANNHKSLVKKIIQLYL